MKCVMQQSKHARQAKNNYTRVKYILKGSNDETSAKFEDFFFKRADPIVSGGSQSMGRAR